ncbi:MAG: hypothetical protein ABJP02_11900 [Parasphingorhabdus sp.]|uniref:hypothetical protein n=1 Tax=Parasphingorhabdus sp. TaxID=2709688 RepID=UPI003296BBA6
MLWQSIGTVVAIGGIFLLRKAWQKRLNAGLEALGGSLLVLFSLIAWSQTSGADKGAALGIIVVVITGGLAVSMTALQVPKRAKREGRQVPERASEHPQVGPVLWLLRIYNGILLFLITGLAAVFISAGLFILLRWFGMEHSANLTLIAFLFSILWSSLAVYVGSQQAMLRKSLIILGLAIAPAVALTLTS